MKSSLRILSAAGSMLALGLAAQAQPRVSVDLDLHLGPPPPVVVRTAPPRHVVEREVRPNAPGPGYVWIGGHNTWRNGDWVWVSGSWAQPPRPNAVWVEGRFDDSSRNWIDGYWSVSTGEPAYVTDRNHNGRDDYAEIYEAPPPPRREVVVTRPSRRHVWVDGYWVWRNRHHEWVPGHWELPPRRNARWVAPRWEHRGRGYVFIEGTWR